MVNIKRFRYEAGVDTFPDGLLLLLLFTKWNMYLFKICLLFAQTIFVFSAHA